jgi:hypothetical protein
MGELHNFYSTPNITGVSKLWFAGHVARIGDMQNDHIIAAHNSEGGGGGDFETQAWPECNIATDIKGRGEQILEASSLRRLNIICWCQIPVGPQCGTCFLSPLWRPEFWGCCQIFGKFVHLCFKESCVDVGSCKDGDKTSYLTKGV